jgi:hypothetical protein
MWLEAGWPSARPVGCGPNSFSRAGVNAARPVPASGMLWTASPSVPFSPGRIGW